MGFVRAALDSLLGSDRRGSPRYATPALRVEIDGNRYRTRDWSLSGFRIEDCHTPLKPGDRIVGRLRLPGGAGQGEFVAEVVWQSPAGEVGVMLKELPPRLLVAMYGIAGR